VLLWFEPCQKTYLFPRKERGNALGGRSGVPGASARHDIGVSTSATQKRRGIAFPRRSVGTRCCWPVLNHASDFAKSRGWNFANHFFTIAFSRKRAVLPCLCIFVENYPSCFRVAYPNSRESPFSPRVRTARHFALNLPIIQGDF
jgi:hypothetical protein